MYVCIYIYIHRDIHIHMYGYVCMYAVISYIHIYAYLNQCSHLTEVPPPTAPSTHTYIDAIHCKLSGAVECWYT